VATAARITGLGPLARPAGAPGDPPMRTSGIEELKSVLRRSVVLIVAVVLFGVLVMNVVRQVGGPAYQASSRVLLNSSDLSSAVLGISQPYQDPTRKDQAEQNLIDSPELYDYAAKRAGGNAGTGPALMASTSATVNNNVVSFVASTSNADRSMRIANLVATAYPSWRAKVSGRAVDAAIAQVRDQIARAGRTSELLRQLQQLQVMKTLSSGETLFVEQATSATKTKPKPFSDSLLGGALGLVIALLIVGGRELFDTTVRSEGDVEDALDAPVLATIESLPRRIRTSVLASGGSRFNDEYELLAANVAQIFDGHQGTVQIAVTSALAGEGKTTTASNLAAALSRRGADVMLADFDLRKPAISEFIGIPRSAPGVAELLSGGAELRSVLWHVQPNGDGWHVQGSDRAEVASAPRRRSNAATRALQSGGEGSLTVIPGGVLRMESNARFTKLPGLLERLPADLDYVVIDTPPALLVAGMAELAQSVDGVVVVVRHGFVHRRRLRALSRQARSWRARVLGAVLNDSPSDESTLSYYYGRP
jgi:Mrp family chromosome partitioning ATPase